MAVDDGRQLLLCRAYLYAKGQGDPVLTDRGFQWPDVLAYSWQAGRSSYTGSTPTLQFLEGVGVVCRPFLVLKDTTLDHYTVSGGTWEAERPGTGVYRKVHLQQRETTAGVVWSARGPTLPANPTFCFSLLFVDTPPDWDADALPPFVRLEFGEKQNQARWAIEFSKTDGTRLLVWDTTVGWIVWKDLPAPLTAGNSDLGECFVVVRWHRGKLLISTDGGDTYETIETPGTDVTVLGSPFTLRGQGGQLIFGLHQLVYHAGVYTSPKRNTFTSRGGVIPPDPVISGRYLTPPGTSVIFADASDPMDGVARYRATLTPIIAGFGPGWAFYRSPELYSVWFRYPPVVAWLSGLGFRTTPFDGAEGRVTDCTIEKPLEHDGATARLEILRTGNVAFQWASGRWPKMQLDLGHRTTGGIDSFTTAFTGYVRAPSIASEVWNEQHLSLQLDNQSILFKRKEWGDVGSGNDRFPLGGFTVNQALDLIMQTEGLYDPSVLNPLGRQYRSWHAWGDNVLLPTGLPEDPFELPRIGESKWETMQRLASYANLEIVPRDDGVFVSGPVNYVAPYVSKTFQFVPTSDLTNLVRGVEYSLDSSESATAVLVTGIDQWGQRIAVYAVNTAAETNPARADWAGLGRELVQEEAPGVTTLGMLLLRCRFLAAKLLGLKFEADLRAVVDLRTGRTDQVRVTGAQVAGITDWDTFAVLTLRHRYRADPSMESLETAAGLRRLG